MHGQAERTLRDRIGSSSCSPYCPSFWWPALPELSLHVGRETRGVHTKIWVLSCLSIVPPTNASCDNDVCRPLPSEISIRLGSELLEAFKVARSDDVQSAKIDLRATLVELARKGNVKREVSGGVSPIVHFHVFMHIARCREHAL